MSNVLARRVFGNVQSLRNLFCSKYSFDLLNKRFYSKDKSFRQIHHSQWQWLAVAGALITGTGAFCYLNVKRHKKQLPFLVIAAASEQKVSEVKGDLSLKQMKFEEFASYEYGGRQLMSPQDFLNSLVDNKKETFQRKRLTSQDINQILKTTQKIAKNKEDLFEHMGENGIITYPEYLFLLTLLSKSSHGLNVAFRMLDLDGNATLGRTEFQELERMLNQKTSAKSLHHSAGIEETLPSTTLLIYFFGASGKGQLTFRDMLNFTRNLQKEFWKQEFRLCSPDEGVVNSEQFAKLLLQSTHLDEKNVREYIGRLKSRVQKDIRVTLEDYIKFGEFLNHLEEFSIALKIYNVANQPVTQEEFKRAVLISTGGTLGDHIVNTIFQLFDIDGDGKLSQKEFLGLMKDRVNKRFTNTEDNVGPLSKFIGCVKSELAN